MPSPALQPLLAAGEWHMTWLEKSDDTLGSAPQGLAVHESAPQSAGSDKAGGRWVLSVPFHTAADVPPAWDEGGTAPAPRVTD